MHLKPAEIGCSSGKQQPINGSPSKTVKWREVPVSQLADYVYKLFKSIVVQTEAPIEEARREAQLENGPKRCSTHSKAPC